MPTMACFDCERFLCRNPCSMPYLKESIVLNLFRLRATNAESFCEVFWSLTGHVLRLHKKEQTLQERQSLTTADLAQIHNKTALEKKTLATLRRFV